MKLRRTATLLGIVGVLSSASAQNTLTTYYVIPPSNGCDGVWAFGPYSALWNSCSGPYMWLFTPAGCVESGVGQPVPLNVVNDTIIMSLCSQPCDFQFYSDTGLCAVCLCGPLVPLNVHARAGADAITVHPDLVPSLDPVLFVELPSDDVRHAQVLDRSGRICSVFALSARSSRVELRDLSPGAYLFLLDGPHGARFAKRFVLE